MEDYLSKVLSYSRGDPLSSVEVMRTREGERFRVVARQKNVTARVRQHIERKQDLLDAIVDGNCAQVCAEFYPYGSYTAKQKRALIGVLKEPGLINIAKGGIEEGTHRRLPSGFPGDP